MAEMVACAYLAERPTFAQMKDDALDSLLNSPDHGLKKIPESEILVTCTTAGVSTFGLHSRIGSKLAPAARVYAPRPAKNGIETNCPRIKCTQFLHRPKFLRVTPTCVPVPSFLSLLLSVLTLDQYLAVINHFC